MKAIAIGAKGSAALDVTAEHLANHLKDPALPPVLATPMLILVIENAALDAIKHALEPGETAVGTRIDICHLSPTPAGVRVVGEARVTAVDGRRVVFRVNVVDEHGQIGAGMHERVVLPMSRIEKAVDAKRQARAHLRAMSGDVA
ncbi:MAG TPA: hotdog domain-containing protein [Stellaceae bacterium]|jgi:fluoroacetyl-CoA thioesterase|nr:hotdog domain-containing protein [Stellaceae bacterium]